MTALIAKAKSTDKVAATIHIDRDLQSRAGAGGVFHFQCFDKDGNLKWEEKTHNLVVNQGLQNMNTQFFKGVSYSAAWYIGLVNNSPTPSFSANDTLDSHGGWDEVVPTVGYSGNRKAATFGTATTADPSVISNSGSPAQFSMSTTVTVNGAFLCNAASGSLITDVLFSVAAFQSPGNRSVVNGDTLNVTYQFSLDAA
jgi:hypothetical protein